MSQPPGLDSLSDDVLLERLSTLVDRHRRCEAELVAHLAEVDARRLYLGKACSSMFSYCVELLHRSEHEAYLRIACARASRRFPVLLDMLADGGLHLSAIAKLTPHLTEDNSEALLGRAIHKTTRQIEALCAEVAPRPEVPARVRKLPPPRSRRRPAEPLVRTESRGPPKTMPLGQRPPSWRPLSSRRRRRKQLRRSTTRERMRRCRR